MSINVDVFLGIWSFFMLVDLLPKKYVTRILFSSNNSEKYQTDQLYLRNMLFDDHHTKKM